MRHLFIGGTADGQFMECSGDRWSVRKRLLTKLPVHPDEEQLVTRLDFEHYRSEAIRTNKRTFRMMVIEGMTIEDALAQLMNRYALNTRTEGKA